MSLSFLMSTVTPESTSLYEEAEGPVNTLLSVKRGKLRQRLALWENSTESHRESEALKLGSFYSDLSSEFTECLERECPPLKTPDRHGME